MALRPAGSASEYCKRLEFLQLDFGELEGPLCWLYSISIVAEMHLAASLILGTSIYLSTFYQQLSLYLMII